ncbi:MAG: hypothetical protein ACRENE_24835 [Polyangiaceae bacterium]
MSSENLGLVAVGVTLFAINAFLGAPIASRIARFFGWVLRSEHGTDGHEKEAIKLPR